LKRERRRNKTVPRTAHTVFHFNLPYAIPVPDGLYKIKIGREIAKVNIERIQVARTGWKASEGTYLQLQYDKYGKSSYSSIKIKIPRPIIFLERGRTPLLINTPPRLRSKEIVLRFLNRLIEVVKYSTGRYWVEDVRYQDITSFEMFYLIDKKLHNAGMSLLDTGTGGIRMSTIHPFTLEREKLEELNNILENEEDIKVEILLLMNTKDACLQENFKLATVEAVTALEVVLNKFIRRKGEEKGIKKGDLDRVIIEVGLTGNISVVLKLLADNPDEIDKDLVSICRGAIRIRNKILHEGLQKIPATETEERIMAIEKMIELIKGLP